MKKNVEINEEVIEGIKTIYIKVPFSPNMHMRFMSLAGSYAENEENQGVAHYLEHMFFKGTKKRSLFDISDDAALLGAKQNAFTSSFNVCYYLTGPSINYKGMVELLSDMMFNPTFPEEEIVKESTVIQEERKSYEDEHSSFFFDQVQQYLCDFSVGHPTIGTEETISNMTRQDFVDYRNQMYGLDNTIFLVAGDLPKKKVFKACKKAFKECNFVEKSNIPEITSFFQNKPPKKIKRKGIQQSFLLGLFDSQNLVDTSAEYACMSNAIGGGMYSLLFKEVREKLGLCYHISSSRYISNPVQGVSYVYTQLDPTNKERAVEAIHAYLDSVRNNGFERKQFECAKAATLGSYSLAIDGILPIANKISSRKIFHLDIDIEKHYQEIVDLSYDEVNEYAAKNVPSDKDISWVEMNPDV